MVNNFPFLAKSAKPKLTQRESVMNDMARVKSGKSSKFENASDVDRLNAENALLRAALEDSRGKIAELEMLADSDTLTPIANRRAFLRELDRVMKNAARHGTKSALLFIDLDGLKAINDAHGHHAGDAMLIHVATGLRGLVRATDVVARLGGDEFGLILEHLSEEQAHAKAERIMVALKAMPLILGSITVPVTPSWGVTLICEEESADNALARADAEMYKAKVSNRS
jgi:diguanylate cyclase (GGDEF)-like protein